MLNKGSASFEIKSISIHVLFALENETGQFIERNTSQTSLT